MNSLHLETSKTLATAISTLIMGVIVFTFSNSTLSQDGAESNQVLQTPDGKLYVVTKDAEGNTVIQPLEPLNSTQQSAVPSLTPPEEQSSLAAGSPVSEAQPTPQNSAATVQSSSEVRPVPSVQNIQKYPSTSRYKR